MDDLIASLDVNKLDANQRIKMLQIALKYTLPRMKQATNEVREDDMPVFRLNNIIRTVPYLEK